MCAWTRALSAAATLMPALAWAALPQEAPVLSGSSRVYQKGAIIGLELPHALCSLVEGSFAKDRPGAYPARSAADFPGLVEESFPTGTGMGYDLGPLRIQGIGLYDPEDNYASLGPAFRLSIDKGFEITTGMQLPVAEGGPGDSPDLYYAELTILF